jgi:hypothetical protein
MRFFSNHPLRWIVVTSLLAGMLWLPAGISSGTARADELGRLQKLDRELDQLIASLKKKKKHHHKKKHHVKKKHHHKKRPQAKKKATVQKKAARKNTLNAATQKPR